MLSSKFIMLYAFMLHGDGLKAFFLLRLHFAFFLIKEIFFKKLLALRLLYPFHLSEEEALLERSFIKSSMSPS